MSTLALILIPAALFVGAVVLVFALANGRRLGPARPLWSYPGMWIALSAVFVLVGVTVFPRLLGFTFVFLPMIWMRGFGNRRERGRRRDDRRADDDDHWPSDHDEQWRPDGDEF